MLSTQKTYNKNKEIIKKQFKLCITKNNRKRYEVDRHMIENVFERRRKMNEHLKKIKGTIDVERGYSLGTVFTTRNKQYMYDTGTGKVFECGANEYQILKSLFEETSLPEKVEGSSEEELEAAYRNIWEMIETEHILQISPDLKFVKETDETLRDLLRYDLQ